MSPFVLISFSLSFLLSHSKSSPFLSLSRSRSLLRSLPLSLCLSVSIPLLLSTVKRLDVLLFLWFLCTSVADFAVMGAPIRDNFFLPLLLSPSIRFICFICCCFVLFVSASRSYSWLWLSNTIFTAPYNRKTTDIQRIEYKSGHAYKIIQIRMHVCVCVCCAPTNNKPINKCSREHFTTAFVKLFS